MAQRFIIHPDNPQGRLVRQTVACLQTGGVIVYPTDTSYALACHIGDKSALDRIRQIRRLDHKHHFTLVCRNLSEAAEYAKVDKAMYRILKRLTPGPYTFIFPATRVVPRRLQHSKRKTIGLRLPDSPILSAILEDLQEPLMSTTLILPDEKIPLSDPDEIIDRLGKQVDIVVDAGACGLDVTTMVDMAADDTLTVLRQGKGCVDSLKG